MREACISRDDRASAQRFMQSLNYTQSRAIADTLVKAFNVLLSVGNRLQCLLLLNYRNGNGEFHHDGDRFRSFSVDGLHE